MRKNTGAPPLGGGPRRERNLSVVAGYGTGQIPGVEQPSGVDAEFFDLACSDRNTAAVLAGISSRGQVVMVTTDGGAHWAIHDVIPTEHLFAITINGKKTVTAVGRFGTIIQAQDLLRPNL